MKSLFETVKDYLTPDVMQKLSSLGGETPENTRRAMDSIIPTVLSGAAKVADSPGGDNQLMSLINKQTSDGNILGNLAGQLSGGNATQGLMNSGRDAAKGLFGGKLNSVIDTLASSLGIKSSSIASLLAIATPLVMGVLGKERSARGLGASGLASLLAGERSILSQMLPAGLGSVLGWGDAGRTEQRVAEAPRYEPSRTTYGVSEQKRSDWWIWPVVGLAALGFLLYNFWPRATIVPEETVAKQEIKPETPVREERTPALQGPAPMQREAIPVPEEPKPARPDTAVSQSPEAPSGNRIERAGRGAVDTARRPVVTREASSGVDIRQVQEALKNQGQNPGPIDGIMGSRTQQALRQFQRANGLEQTGTLDEVTLQKLGSR
jgi:hypothetical protein